MPQDFDKLWDYSKPAETEQKFRSLLPEAERANDPSELAQLLTQIARTQGLQNRFDEAHATLDRVEKMLNDNLKLARIRYLLERGRVFDSSGKPDRAGPLFVQASALAIAEKQNRYAIDAVHMIAIAQADPQKQVEWNLKSIAMAQADPEQRGWLFSLYNNIAESYALLKDYQSALSYTNKLLDFQRERGEPDPYTLKDKARFHRLLGHPDESLAIIQKVAETKPDDGWIEEELAESLEALGRAVEAKPHFAKAYELLSKDDWCVRHEMEKLKHLENMAIKQMDRTKP